MRAAPSRSPSSTASRIAVLETARWPTITFSAISTVAAGAKRVGAARAVLAELAVEAQDEGPRPEALLEVAAREVVRRRVPQLLVEGHHDRVTHAGAGEERETMLDGGQRAGRPAEKDGLGVLREGHHRGLGAELGRASDVGGEDRLVAEVNAVEDAHARHRARLRRSEGARVPGDLQGAVRHARPVRTGSRCADGTRL